MGDADFMHTEDIMGSIEVEKLGYFLIIPVDYMTIPAKDIGKIKPKMKYKEVNC